MSSIPAWATSSMRAIVALLGALGLYACADKAPPARFSDPSPPALAKPLPEAQPGPASDERATSETGTPIETETESESS